MKKILMGMLAGIGMTLAVSAFTLNPFNAGTVYVAKTGSDSTGDGSEAKPYLTVQKGVDMCPTSGTVVIGDGDYSDVGAMIASDQTAGKTFGTVVNLSKRIRLTSKNGKAKTRIVGTWSSQNLNGFEGVGEGAVRCITVGATSAAAGANAFLIDNLTITHGAVLNTTAGNKNDDNGAGVYCTGHDTDVTHNDRVYVVDCDITDCRAGVGAAIGRAVCPIRCLIARNAAYQGSQIFYRSCHAYNCVFVGNGATGMGLRNANSGIFTAVQTSLAVNCTFLGNFVNAICAPNSGTRQLLYNCCALGSGAINDGATLFSEAAAKAGELVNSVQSGSTANGSPSRTGISSFQYRSPATDDWTMLSDGALLDAGSDDHYLQSWVPEEYQNTDFLGNPRKVGAHVDIGAIECQGADDTFALADAVHGFLYCTPATRAQKGDLVIEPGCWAMLDDARCWRVTTVYGEERFFGYNLRGQSNEWRFPDRGADNGFWFSPYAPEQGRNEIDAYVCAASRVYDVDASYAGEASDGSTEKPFKTIQDAINACTDSYQWRINVRPGTYAEGEGTLARVTINHKSVRVVSTAGAEQTVIKGGDNLRCVSFSNATAQALQGFTLTGANLSTLGVHGGGAYVASSYVIACQVTDCVISNNVGAGRGVGVYGLWAQRCLITGNATTAENQARGTSGGRGTATYEAICSSCVIRNNPKGCTSANQESWLINCTLIENGTETLVDPAGSYKAGTYRIWNTANNNSAALNCAFYGTSDNSTGNYYNAGNIRLGSVQKLAFAAASYANLSDYFANASIDGTQTDFRPVAGADGLNKGAETFPGTIANSKTEHHFRRYEIGDMNGGPLTYGSSGYPLPGAYQSPVPVVTISSVPGIVIEPSGRQIVEGDSLDVTVTLPEGRTVEKWTLNGVDQPDSGMFTFHYVPTASSLTADTLVAVPESRNFYVNANAADDTGDALTPATAAKRLVTVMAKPGLYPGDVVHAAPGDYNEGSAVYAGDPLILAPPASRPVNPASRVIVPEGVTLVADEGRDVTFITGAEDNKTWGPNAVRSVTALRGATVKGFTIRNGATLDQTGGNFDNNIGGNVIAHRGSRADAAVIADCIIQGGIARNGCGVAGGILRRCVVYGGTSGSGSIGLGTIYSRHENCVIGWYGYKSSLKNVMVLSHCGMYNSIYYSGNQGAAGDAELQSDGNNYPIVNSLICINGRDSGAYTIQHVRNCMIRLINSAATGVTFDAATCSDNVFLSNWNDAKLSAFDPSSKTFYVPAEDSPVIDAGNAALVDYGPDATDLVGVPRVLNDNRIDIGAYEYDWRPVFAACLTPKKLVVDEADPSVTTNAAGALVIPSGAVSATWTAAVASAKLPVEVTGTGTLSLYLNETLVQTVTAAEGPQTLKLSLAKTGANVFRFVYEPGASDNGAALLGALDYSTGCMLIFR